MRNVKKIFSAFPIPKMESARKKRTEKGEAKRKIICYICLPVRMSGKHTLYYIGNENTLLDWNDRGLVDAGPDVCARPD